MNTTTIPEIFARYTEAKYNRFQKWLYEPATATVTKRSKRLPSRGQRHHTTKR